MRKITYDENIVPIQSLKIMLKQGFTMRQIANHFSVGLNVITAICRRLDLHPPEKPLMTMSDKVSDAFIITHRDLFTKVKKMYFDEMKSYDQIAKELGYSQSYIAKLFSVYNVKVPRERMLNPMHDAVRGKKRTLDELIKRAIGKEHKPPAMSKYETQFANLLNDARIPFVFNKAIGKYNVDFAIGDSIAVEIYGGLFHTTGRAVARLNERMDYILNAGWNIYIIWCFSNKSFVSDSCFKDFITFREAMSRNKASIGQYRVVRGNGDFVSVGSLESDYLPHIIPYKSSIHSLA